MLRGMASRDMLTMVLGIQPCGVGIGWVGVVLAGGRFGVGGCLVGEAGLGVWAGQGEQVRKAGGLMSRNGW